MKIIGIIPARYGSSRLPGKPLKDICGKPMIQHVYERACECKLLDAVIVATDDQRIVDVVEAFGGKAMMTSVNHQNGSERIAEVAQAYDCDIVVNIQGDEPLIQPEIIDEIVEALIANEDVPMSTGCYKLPDDDSLLQNENVVKVVFDRNERALYFSRSLIPYPRKKDTFAAYEHIGIYAYRKDFLMKYITLPNTPLQETESLEQLKVLENGYPIQVVPTKFNYNALSVDTEEDLNMVIRLYKEKHGLV